MSWLHPLDPGRVRYRAYGRGRTLPGFWTLCDDCERVYTAGDDQAVVRRMKTSHAWSWTTPQDEAELVRRPLAVFRAADQGSHRLAE